MKIIPFFALLFFFQHSYAQQDYTATLLAYQKNYISTHEVVKEKDKKYFRFFAIDSTYRVDGIFEKITDTASFSMKTSGNSLQRYFKYGKIIFKIRDTALQLFVYQSVDLIKTKNYADYLFIPFTDLTTGAESYGSGRYIDLSIPQIINNKISLDFNKAYNPYCAYAAGFHCPIPLKENFLTFEIKSGEMNFAAPLH